MDKHTAILEEVYVKAETDLNQNNQKVVTPQGLSREEIDLLNYLIERSEHSKGVITVVVTSLTHKIFNCNQDIRCHQSNLKNGYSGRTIDTKYVTPFMKAKRLTHMEESGWLTRSLEQNYPYDLSYNGKIRPIKLKETFLKIIDNIQNKNVSPKDYLEYMFQMLILQRERGNIQLIRSNNKETFPIAVIIMMLTKHFEICNVAGTARLPVLAVYSVYECLINQLKRFEGKELLQLESHTSADYRSGEIGDIQVNSSDGVPFEGVEIKYDKRITSQIILDCYGKFKQYPLNRYYCLSTIEPSPSERVELDETIESIFNEHGCQVIANGLIPTIKYYLRLMTDTNEFINFYSKNLMEDKAIKTEHKVVWSNILEKYGYL